MKTVLSSSATEARASSSSLDPAGKSALLLEGKGGGSRLPPRRMRHDREYLRKLIESDAKPLPDKVIDNVQTQGATWSRSSGRR